ncbi:DNA primase [Pseudanabaena sp. FACHB-1998]|uniref:DNA primase n=1 Tax=Pseudanabaena sp. FACHB-1998 TaxID=2692858 RepID=UPI001681A690|nr:DNA primase [Pseudanabaena sp. FACHB-1998]MBD2176881.1 DNA primase [Pseudanabaena sp. FACHB-1998]
MSAQFQIHKDTIDQVSQRADIVDIVSERVVLRKSGANFRGACPFHNGTNATALTVNPSRQMYHCFNCGAAGGAVKFLMEIDKRSFTDVVLDLAKRYNVPIQTVEPEKAKEIQRQISHRDRLYEVMALTTSFYQHALSAPQGREALAYLIEKRKMSKETIQKFQLGYSPAGWETLMGYLVQQKQIPLKLVEEAGLVVPRKTGNGFYDRFRDRLMIPIHDTRGRVIAFGGRSLGNEEPKYLNSPETELFSKGTVLFAMDKARDAIAKSDQAIVVEGYFDAIALHQAGIEQAIATMGVALNADQMKQLLRYTESKNVILNFDADKAGITAAEKAIGGFKELVFNGTVQLRVLTMPNGKDADEYLKQYSAEGYRDLLKNAPLFLDWQIDQILAGQDLNQADHFQKSSQAIAQLLNNLPVDSFFRTHYIHTSAQRLSQGNSYLALRLEQDLRRQLRNTRWNSTKPAPSLTTSANALHSAEMQLLQIYLHFPQHRAYVYAEIEENEIEFSLSNHRFLWQTITNLIQENKTSLNTEELYPEHLIQQLQILCTEQADVSQQLQHLLWLDENSRIGLLRPQMVVRTAIAKIQYVMCEKREKYWLELFKSKDVIADPEFGHHCQDKIREEKQRKREIQKLIEVNYIDLSGTSHATTNVIEF